MKIIAWMELYEEILRDFNFNPRKDYISSAILSNIIRCYYTGGIQISRFKGKRAYVIGSGPDLKESLESISGGFTIVADSAVEAFYNIIGCPDIIVTDLDGNLDAIRQCSRGGSIVVVHAHGDNIPEIKRHASYFIPGMIGTTQNIPLYNVYNFGGFTDGDRAAFLADHLKSPQITLVAFDFEKPFEKHGRDPAMKIKKLNWAKRLLEILSAERGTAIVSGNFIDI